MLINPPWSRIFGEEEEFHCPLGLCYIAGILEKHGFNVSIYNADFKTGIEFPPYKWQRSRAMKYNEYLHILRDFNHSLWKEIGAVISKQSPDIVGISITTNKYGSALNVSKWVKDFDPNIPVVFGGVHPTVLPEESLKNKNVDIVVRGEGEYTFLDLVENIDNLDKVLGITYEDNGKIVHNPDRPLIRNLDELPFPAKHLLLEKDNLPPEAYGLMFASRGCPYKCVFCASHKVWTRKVRYRSPENVIDEINYTQERFGPYLFRFVDDTFILNKKFVTDFCDLLIKEKLDIAWRCDVRANLVTDELIKKMKVAGCNWFSMGVESGNEETLEKIKKGNTIGQVKKANKVLKENKVRSTQYFMVFPWETKEEIEKTISLIKELDPYIAIIGIATPYPGTELYDICRSEGLMPEKIDWNTFFSQSPDIYLNKNFTKEEFFQIIREAEELIEERNKKKRREMLLLDPLYFIKRVIKGKYNLHELWVAFRYYLWK